MYERCVYVHIHIYIPTQNGTCVCLHSTDILKHVHFLYVRSSINFKCHVPNTLLIWYAWNLRLHEMITQIDISQLPLTAPRYQSDFYASRIPLLPGCYIRWTTFDIMIWQDYPALWSPQQIRSNGIHSRWQTDTDIHQTDINPPW